MRSTSRRIPASSRASGTGSSRPPRSTKQPARAVDHDLGDRRVGEQRLERAEPGDLVGELARPGASWRSGPSSGSASCSECAESRGAARGAGAPTSCLDRVGADEPLVHASPERGVGVGRRGRGDAHAAAPRRSHEQPERRAGLRRRGRASGVGQPVGQDAGVDRAGDRVARRDPGDDRPAEHVGDLAGPDRPARLLDARRARRPDRAPDAGRRAAARGSSPRTTTSVDVGDLEHARAAAGASAVPASTSVGTGPSRSATASAAPASAAGRGASARRRVARAGSARRRARPRPRAGRARRSGASGPAASQSATPVAGFGAEAEDRGLVAAEIDEPDARRAGEARARRRRRTRTCRSHPWVTRARGGPLPLPSDAPRDRGRQRPGE